MNDKKMYLLIAGFILGVFFGFYTRDSWNDLRIREIQAEVMTGDTTWNRLTAQCMVRMGYTMETCKRTFIPPNGRSYREEGAIFVGPTAKPDTTYIIPI